MHDLSGRMLGNQFRLECLLGRGGMGDVYLAEQLEVGRRVVVKVLRAPHLSAPQSEERFRREARALAQLNHPNIVHLYTAGRTDDELAYLAMEYVEGRTLGSVIGERGALPEVEVLGILDQLCSALVEAHGRGVIHRDLKPDNVMLIERRSQPPLVKVLDFGIAKLAHMPDARITRDGEVIGTPLYMAPEQLRNKQVDERADIYALGAIGYEMLTGHLPFEGDTTLSVIARVLSERVIPPRERIPGLPLSAATDALIERCLAKEAADRYDSAQALRDALAAIAHGAAPHARGERERPAHAEHHPPSQHASSAAAQVPHLSHGHQGQGHEPEPLGTQHGWHPNPSQHGELPARGHATHAAPDIAHAGGRYSARHQVPSPSHSEHADHTGHAAHADHAAHGGSRHAAQHEVPHYPQPGQAQWSQHPSPNPSPAAHGGGWRSAGEAAPPRSWEVAGVEPARSRGPQPGGPPAHQNPGRVPGAYDPTLPDPALPDPADVWRHARVVADDLWRRPTPLAVEQPEPSESAYPVQLRAADGLSLAMEDDPHADPLPQRRSGRPWGVYLGALVGVIAMGFWAQQMYDNILRPKLEAAEAPALSVPPPGALLPLREWVQGIPFPEGTRYTRFEPTVIDAQVPASAAHVSAFYENHLARSWGGVRAAGDGTLTFADPHGPVARIQLSAAGQGSRVVITRRPSAQD
ncbi:MAG: protein kinase [Polyangiales bacterium]